MVFEVPFFGGVEGEFEADEEGLLVAFESVDGLGREFAVEANEGFLVGVLGVEDFVLRELGTGREGIVEHEVVFEKHFVERRVFGKLDVEVVFLFADILFEEGEAGCVGMDAKQIGIVKGVPDLAIEHIHHGINGFLLIFQIL